MIEETKHSRMIQKSVAFSDTTMDLRRLKWAMSVKSSRPGSCIYKVLFEWLVDCAREYLMALNPYLLQNVWEIRW